MENIGIGVTTHNRADIFQQTMTALRQWTPAGVPIVVVDDGSTEPLNNDDGQYARFYRFEHARGVAAAKNKCLEMLSSCGVEHMFLFDDDTFPTAANWWRPYVQSPQHHLCYGFTKGPNHWPTRVTQSVNGDLRWFDRPRGCMLYVHRDVLPVVGGMHVAYGKHGGEHGNWSDRIHAAGFTTQKYPDIKSPRIKCLDEVQTGISSVDWREHQTWRHVDSTQLPAYAEYKEMPVPVLVPRRDDHGHRDELWNLLKGEAYWRGPWLTDFQVIEGPHHAGPFNRSAGVNLAARLAGNWDVAVIADSDTWVEPYQLEQAVRIARKTGKLVAAFDKVRELDKQTTMDMLYAQSVVLHQNLKFENTRRGGLITQSSMLVVPRELWQRVHGMDERFIGWGGEDNAFWRACELVAGDPVRLPGPAMHLWHPKSNAKQNVLYQRNYALWRRYEACKTVDDLDKVLS